MWFERENYSIKHVTCSAPCYDCRRISFKEDAFRFIGVPLLIAGAKHAFPKVVEIVENTNKLARIIDKQVLVLDNN